MSNSIGICPACADSEGLGCELTAPGVCPKCGPLKFFVVTQPRVLKVEYRQRVWAPTAEAAQRIAATLPDSYDERRLRCFAGKFEAVEEVDPEILKIWGVDVGIWPEECLIDLQGECVIKNRHNHVCKGEPGEFAE